MYKLDQTWQPFSNLMLKHIYNILLICSDYDRFMLEEDCRIEEELYKEYMSLGLSTPPKITHASNEKDALTLVSSYSFDLVITVIDFSTNKSKLLAQKIKDIKPQMPVIVLATATDNRKIKTLKEDDDKNIDQLFYYQGNSKIFMAMVKLVEDSINIDHDTSIADIQVIILIEDSIRFISSYLPQMYTCLIEQNRMCILEALNEWGKTLRMRGRPKILLARTGEQGMAYYKKYRKNVLGIITDVTFPYKKGTEESGIKIVEELRKIDENLPILMQSSEKKHEASAIRLNTDFVWKNSPSLLSSLEEHFIKYYKFGPLNLIDPRTGDTIATANTLKQLQYIIKDIDIDSLIYHCMKKDLSKWIRSQSLYSLASSIRDLNYMLGHDREAFRWELYNTIKRYRTQRTRGVIAQFSPNSYDDTSFFSRIGTGSLGGKGRGLAFIAAAMMNDKMQEDYKDIYLSIPKTVVITTSLYDSFIEQINLDTDDLVIMKDKEILKLFLSYPLPDELNVCLVEFLKVVSKPITVRSSSLLEDSHSQPFAGVYETCMLTNNGSFEKRYKEIQDAIKTVWASVFFSCARDYLKMADKMVEEEKMAIILQQATGSIHGSYFYPNISGVARSLNYYPVGNQKSEDGIAMVSFGFGKAVVDDGSAFRFSPGKPKKPSNSLNGESFTQEEFYVLDMNSTFDPFLNIDNLVNLPLKEAEKYPESLKYIASTLDLQTGMISESLKAEGLKFITFNGMLKYDMFPLAPIINDVLKLGASCMDTPVEIEIAVNTERNEHDKPDFSILQIRPIATTFTDSDVQIREEDIQDSYVYSTTVMGNGIINNVRHIVIIKPEVFTSAKMINMPEELALLNKEIDTDYLLIAAGRLGSSDPYLGIPCAWSDISNARVIVETGLPKLQVEPSQGTHFFQNMTSLGCVYLTVNPTYNDGKLDFDKLNELELVSETTHFRHIVSKEDLDIRVNGLEKKAIIKQKKDIILWD